MWEYYDKNKKYNKLGPITPLKFYQDYVKPHFNMEDKVLCKRGHVGVFERGQCGLMLISGCSATLGEFFFYRWHVSKYRGYLEILT